MYIHINLQMQKRKIKLNNFIRFNQFIFHNFAENKPQTVVYIK